MRPRCPFRTWDEPRVAFLGKVGAFRDIYPSAPGHTLVIPQRHVARLSELTAEEARDVFELAQQVAQELELSHKPDGFTIGVNDGWHAGQAVEHFHLHVIPRYVGDVADPRGGVRWVLPETAPYWMKP